MGLFHVFTEMFNNQEDAPILESECKHVNSTGECSLIQRLKKLQAQKKEVDKQIKDYEKSDYTLAENFIKILITLEKSGLFMYCRDMRWGDKDSGIKRYFEYHSTRLLEDVLGDLSTYDIKKVCNELNELSNKGSILAEKRELSNKLAAEIKDIKDTLGIE